MNLLEALRTALLDLALHKFRSALAMVSISEGAKREALERIAVLGVENIIIRSVKPSQADAMNQNKQQWQAEYGLLRRDLEHVRAHFPSVRHAVGVKNTRKRLF